MAETGPPSKVWARSLRQETALQDHYRRTIHHSVGGVENVGFDRWNAACCLQEQVDSARGVEHTRRLVRSRAIAARFSKRSVMKDLQGTELHTANSACDGVSNGDGSLTRGQALEKFGIDLGRVGVMTSARTASRHSLIDGGSSGDQGPARGDDGERVATNYSSDVDGHGRGKAQPKAQRTEIEGGRGGSSGVTTANKVESNNSSNGVAARRQEAMSEKLKMLDKLLSDDFLGQMPADEERGGKSKTTKACMQSEEDYSTGDTERTGAGNAADGTIVGLRNNGDGKGRESRLDFSPPEIIACGAEPRETTTADGERGGAADYARDAPLQENATVKEVMEVERNHRHKKALPNHRPCLWWAFLLPPHVEGVGIPDMVFSVPTACPSYYKKLGTRTEAAEEVLPNQSNDLRTTSPSPRTGAGTDAATNAPARITTNRPSSKSSSQQSLLWAFSEAVNHADGGGGDANTSTRAAPPNPRLGVASLVDGSGCDGGPAKVITSTKESSCAEKLSFSKKNSSVEHPPGTLQRSYIKVVHGHEGLLRATRAICECGRRGGGGTSSEGGSSKLKLPLALLKLWGGESDEERGRNNQNRKLGTPTGGRRLRVISLWTQTEVLGALRDMARGRWLRRGERTEQVSGLFGSDQDACCVQAFTESARFTDEGNNGPRDGASGAALNVRLVHGRNQSRRARRAPQEDSGLSGPVFYRTAWRRTGEKLFVWKITSRYPYVSSLSAHFCPLVRVGSAAPFTASQAEEGAVVTAKAKTENLAKILRRAYDPTLQRLWADWAVNKSDGRWLLIEVHGIKTDADVLNAAAARAAPPAFAKVESRVYRSKHGIPPKHFCGDPDDLEARIAAANPTQEISLVEIAKRAAAASASKHQPSRPPTPSKVAASTQKALLAKQAAVSEHDRSRSESCGVRHMRNQYWRCAGDFCETHSSGQGRKSPSHGKATHNNPENISALERQPAEGVRKNKSTGATHRGTGTVEAEGAGGGDGREYEVEDIVGRRKHALAVEIPRTVLFRLVLNARATLLGWGPSAFDFSQMEKPVQLCSACFMVCSTLERERIETTRRAMDAADEAAREGKARRSRRPPGWKSRVQHELEVSLDADRKVVSRLIDSFETTQAATPSGKKRVSSSRSSRGKNHTRPRQNGSVGRAHGGVSVTWADRFPVPEVHLDREEDRVDASAQSTPRGKDSAPAAGQTLMVVPTRRTRTVSLAPTSGRKRSSPALAKVTQMPYFVGTDAKGRQEEDGKKREVRARRKAKERARRRLRNLATDDASARNQRGEPPEKEDNKVDCSGGNAGGTENADHHQRGRELELPRILRPTAPTPLPSKVPPDCVLTSDSFLMETRGYHQPGQPREPANSATPDSNLRESPCVESSNYGAVSGYSEDDFVDDTQPQILRPIASRENWGAKEGIALERQGDSEETGYVPVYREGSTSDYGNEVFEDDAT